MQNEVRNGKIALYTFLEVAAIFVLTMVGCMWDWVKLGFTLSQITQAEYWNNVIMQTTMYCCAAIVGMLVKLEIDELGNKDYFSLIETYREKLKFKASNFVYYIDMVFNPGTKMKFLHKKYQMKLYMLDKFSKDSWKLEYQLCKKDKEHTPSGKFATWYCNRRKNLEVLESDQFIKDNWASMSCKYPKVNAQAFTYYLDIKMTDKSAYKVENNTARDIPLKITRKIIYAILGSLVLGLIVYDPSVNELISQANGWISVVVKYAIRVLMVVVNLLVGIYTGKKLFQENYILPISNRIRILDEYVLWYKNNPETSEYKEEVEKIKAELESKYNKKIKELDDVKKKAEHHLATINSGGA